MEASPPQPVVLVHCVHGHNLTGYFIVHALVAVHGYTVAGALAAFAHLRPPGLYRPEYAAALEAEFGCAQLPLPCTAFHGPFTHPPRPSMRTFHTDLPWPPIRCAKLPLPPPPSWEPSWDASRGSPIAGGVGTGALLGAMAAVDPAAGADGAAAAGSGAVGEPGTPPPPPQGQQRQQSPPPPPSGGERKLEDAVKLEGAKREGALKRERAESEGAESEGAKLEGDGAVKREGMPAAATAFKAASSSAASKAAPTNSNGKAIAKAGRTKVKAAVAREAAREAASAAAAASVDGGLRRSRRDRAAVGAINALTPG